MANESKKQTVKPISQKINMKEIKNTQQSSPKSSGANPQQKIETANYIPTYRIKPEFKQVVLKAIGNRPFNEIAGLIDAIDVDTMDHQTLNQIVNALGQFPYINVAPIIRDINQYITQVIPE